MASDIHQVTLTGRAGAEAEIKEVGGTTLAVFNLAVTQYRGTKKEADTAWWRCQLWGPRAQVAQYIKKGAKLTVIGRLLRDEATKDGKKGYYYYVDVDDLVLPDKSTQSDDGDSAPKSARGAAKPTPEKAAAPRGKKAAPKKDLPF